MTITLHNTKLDGKIKKVVEEFCNDLLAIDKIDIISINLYGKEDMSMLIIVKDLDIEELKSIKDIVADFRPQGVNTFFITENTLLTSTDVFPIKFMIIKESSSCIYGRDVLKDLEISNEFLRLRCEQEIKHLTLNLKRYYLENYGMRLMAVMKDTIESFIQSLRVLVSLKTGEKPCFEECIETSAKLIGFDSEKLQKVKDLENLTEKPKAHIREEIFGGYIEVVYKTAQFVDAM